MVGAPASVFIVISAVEGEVQPSELVVVNLYVPATSPEKTPAVLFTGAVTGFVPVNV